MDDEWAHVAQLEAAAGRAAREEAARTRARVDAMLDEYRDAEHAERERFESDLRRSIVAAWRAANRGTWHFVSGAVAHVCRVSDECEIVHLVTRYYPSGSYLCVAGACRCDEIEGVSDEWRAHTHRGTCRTIDDTYVCRYTGMGHVCDGAHRCRAIRVDVREGEETCLVSSRVVAVGRMETSIQSSERVNGTYSADTDTKLEFKRQTLAPSGGGGGECCSCAWLRTSGALCAESDAAMIALTHVRRARNQSRTDYYLALAAVRVGLVFSKQRFATDAAADAALPLMRVSDETRVDIIMMYAHRCLLQWAIVQMRTRVADLPPFYDFVLVCLFVFQRGVCVSRDASRHGRAVEILRADDFLRVYLIDSGGIEGGTARAHTAFVASAKHFSSSLSLLSRAIYAAVRDDGVRPELMRPTSLRLDDIPPALLLRAPLIPRRKRLAARKSNPAVSTAKRARRRRPSAK